MADKFHSEADEQTHNKLQEVVKKHHVRLQRSRFLILLKHGGWESKGKTVFGKAKVLADDLRRVLRKDVMLYLNADMWRMLTEQQKEFVLDHTLCTLDVKKDNDGYVKEAADGRPLLGTVPPDIEGFADVIRRHGVIMEDVKRLAKALTETNQLTIDDVAAQGEQSEPPREGVRGKINPDGTVDVDEEWDESRQLTLEQAAVAAEGGAPAEEDPMDGVDDPEPF